MTPKEVQQAWTVQKHNLKEKIAALTNNDILCSEGLEDEMMVKLATKFGKTQEEIASIIKAI